MSSIFLIIVIAVIVAKYLLDVIVARLNLSRLSPDLPSEFTGYYDAEKYATSQRYTRERTRFGMIENTLDVLVIIPFILLGGFGWLDSVVRSLGQVTIVNGLIFAGILIIVGQILGLPFSIYSTFVIEEKYGFNRTTPKTFVFDMLKGLLLTIIIGAPIFALLQWFFLKFGKPAWFYAWGMVTAFQLLMMYIAPTWIMPLFNKFTPLEDGELKTSVEEYARKQEFALQGIYKMDGSRRSSRSNAFFTGFGKSRRIALYDTLMERHTVTELVGVLAHEIGHYKLGHIPKRLAVGVMSTGMMLFLLSLFMQEHALYEAFQIAEPSVYTGMIIFGFLYAPISLALGIFGNWSSRRDEYEADAFAANTTGDAPAMIEALKKLSVDNLSNLTPHPLKVFLTYDHPPVLVRVTELKRLST
ncbi:M48 family metallopeptidase [Calditrichota bacterium]